MPACHNLHASLWMDCNAIALKKARDPSLFSVKKRHLNVLQLNFGRVENTGRRTLANPCTPPHQTGRADFPHPAFLQVLITVDVIPVLGRSSHYSFGLCF